MKEQVEDEGARRRWRSKTKMKEQDEDSSLVSFTQGVANCRYWNLARPATCTSLLWVPKDEDEGARRRSTTKMKEQDEDEGTRRRLISKTKMKEQDEDEENVLELHPLGAFL